MIDIRLDPILVRWGPVILSWHGLFLAAGVVVVYAVAVRLGSRRGLAHRLLSELALWMILAGLVGARLLSVLGEWPAYAAHPEKILAVWEGGLTVIGGLLGGIVAAVLYTWRKRLDTWKLLDVLALSIPLGYVVGRVGCIVNGDVWGLPTGSGWGLVYWNPQASVPPDLLGVPTFPAPIVLQLWSLGVLALLLAVRRRVPYDGLLLSIYLAGYGLGRLIVGAWQPGEPVLLGLRFLQVMALGLILLGVASAVCLRYRRAAGGASQQCGVE